MMIHNLRISHIFNFSFPLLENSAKKCDHEYTWILCFQQVGKILE